MESLAGKIINQSIMGSFPSLERFYAIAFEAGRVDEREECAKVCENEACGGSAFNSASNYMAKAIRARGDTK
jgi:hypothetical protein